MRKGIQTTLLLLFVSLVGFSQELNCTVTLNAGQIRTRQQTDQQVFVELEKGIQNFINNTRWTNDMFAQEEKIKCNLVITLLNSKAQNVFSGRAQFQVIRPVYGTSYESVVFQYVDQNFDFSFAPEERQMIFNEQTFSSNLTSMLAFYAFMGLAADYDSFRKTGGTEFIQRAFNVVTLAGSGAWSQTTNDRRTRYWLMENYQNQQFLPFREAFYTYHRLVLDDISTNPAEKRRKVIEILKEIKNLQAITPNSPLINGFFDAKAVELVNILSEATKEERIQAFQILSELDPEKTETYRPLTK